MPEQAMRKYLVAQAGEGRSAAQGETRTSVGREPEKGGENPVTAHSPWQFTICGGIVALILVVLSIAATRRLKKVPGSKLQSLLESVVEFFNNFTRAAIGEGGEKYAPLIGTLFIFILFSNLFGLIPLSWFRHGEGGEVTNLVVAPTANLGMTLALALVVFFTVQVEGIRARGAWGYLKHFAGPVPALAPLMFPLEIISEISRPISLSIRLFGNIFGEETVIAVLITLAAGLMPLIKVPIPFQFPMLVFGIFTATVQALVFSLLACVYLSLAVAHHEEHGEAHDLADQRAVAAH